MMNIKRPGTSSRIWRKRCGLEHTQHITRRIPYSSNVLEHFLDKPQLYACLVRPQA
jgi:hypothetical protein